MTEEEPTEEEPEVESKPKSKNTIFILVPLAAFAGIAGFMYVKNNKGKKPAKPGMDPDADYDEDEEEDFLSGLDEEAEDEIDEESVEDEETSEEEE